MPVSQHRFNELGFAHTHDVVISGQTPVFRKVGDTATPDGGCIYLWVSPLKLQAHLFDVLYVGKTGGMHARVSQHQASFSGNGTGRKNRDLIESWLADGRTLSVYARRSDTQLIFDEETSLYAAEEAAACSAFRPRWNRARFADVRLDAPPPQGVDQQAIGAALGNAVTAAVEHVPQGEGVTAFFESLAQTEQRQFIELMAMLEQRHPDAGDKVVRGYGGQPSGYNGKPMFVMGNVPPDGGRARDWFARIPLVNLPNAPLTVIFPLELLNPDLAPELIALGTASRNVWRPLDLVAFLEAPDVYLRD